MSSSAQDKNSEFETAYKESIKFYDAELDPFVIYGIVREDGADKFCRMPDAIAKAVSVQVSELNYTYF